MHSEKILDLLQKEWHGTFKSYLKGFLISLFLTTVSFFITIQQSFPKFELIIILMTLAFIQVITQLKYFLHVSEEERPKYGFIALYFTLIILLVIVIGSLWIMNDLDYRMMPNMHMEMKS